MSRFTNPVPQFWLDDGTAASSGRLYFYENKNYSLAKKTYSQPDNTVENTHPVKLDGQGRMPSCFGDGLYSVKFYAANPENPNIDGELQWTRDDVSLSQQTGQFDTWLAVLSYPINSIVKDPSDGEYYKLYGSVLSKGEQPSVTPSKWEKIAFITYFNSVKAASTKYKNDEIVIYNGKLYASNIDDNSSTPPSSSWDNISFNNAITGDLTVSGTIFGGIDKLYTNSGTLNVTFLSNGKYAAFRYDNFISFGINVQVSSSMTTTASVVGFIPADFRPTTEIVRCDGVSASGAIMRGIIESTGTISFIRVSGTPLTEYFTFSFVYSKNA